jgi:hypothetical protein
LRNEAQPLIVKSKKQTVYALKRERIMGFLNG